MATCALTAASISAHQWLGYGYLCLFGALLAYLLWFRGIARLSPVSVSSLGLFSPLTAVVLGWVLLGQTLSALSLLGFFTVLASVLTVQLATRAPAAIARQAAIPVELACQTAVGSGQDPRRG